MASDAKDVPGWVVEVREADVGKVLGEELLEWSRKIVKDVPGWVVEIREADVVKVLGSYFSQPGSIHILDPLTNVPAGVGSARLVLCHPTELEAVREAVKSLRSFPRAFDRPEE